MRLTRFKLTISHVPGKQLVTAYTLSRAPLQIVSKKITTRTTQFVNTVKSFPATEERIKEIKAHQEKNPIYQKIIHDGWHLISEPIKPYFPFAAEL